jgi:tetratricopeptide (TPR) repeat protein
LALTDALLRTGQPEEAVKECAAAAAAFPRSMRIRLGAARICGQLGRHPEALDYARQGLALAAELPKPPTVLVSDLHIAEGASLGGLGKVDEGIEAYRKAVAATPDRFAAHFTLASFSSNHRKLETARESFERALEIRPGNLEATTGLGFVHQQAGRPDEALECFERALEANPTHAPALSGIAEVHMAKGRTEEALESARALVTVAPNAGFAYYTLARALTGVGQYDEALRVVRRAAPMVPAWQIQFFVGDVSVRQGKYGDAAQAYRSALREQPTNLEVYGKLIDALHADGEQEKALEVARAAVKAVPGQGVSHFMEGLSLSVLRRYDEARAAYERALKLDFDNAFVRGAMADLLAATRKHEEALERLREIAKKKPDADAYYTLAWALATYPGAAERKPREALALARNANEMKPGSHRTLAAALYRAGRHAEAEAAFAQALDDGTDQHACGAYLRAMNLQKLGREEDARKWFEEAERRMAGEGKFPLPDHRWLRKEAVQVLGEGKKR